MYDSLNMHSLESSLIDIMRAEQDPMKSKAAFPSFLCPSGGGGGVVCGGGDHVRRRGPSGSVQGGDRPRCSQGRVVFPHASLFPPLLRA